MTPYLAYQNLEQVLKNIITLPTSHYSTLTYLTATEPMLALSTRPNAFSPGLLEHSRDVKREIRLQTITK
ncbi:3361_t:CDS:2 [Gigaspora margarita]|uniref:3361_t:CDS:1 n=1 Tax=Gigaspora margarita TaxID=4874 RepID=A0ABN7UIC1_GIGMA|nr:3361_t:CDS:2 [Gigaspora margarita]